VDAGGKRAHRRLWTVAVPRTTAGLAAEPARAARATAAGPLAPGAAPGAACLLDGWRPTKRQRRNLEDDVWTRLLAAKRLTEVFPGNAQCRTARHRKRGEHGRPLVQEVVVHPGRHAARQWNPDVGKRKILSVPVQTYEPEAL